MKEETNDDILDKMLQKMLEENQKRAKFENNKDIQELLQKYTNAEERSVTRARVRKEGHRKKVINDFIKRIKIFLLTGLIVGLIITPPILIEDFDITRPIASITEPIKHSQEINNLIKEKEKIMDLGGESPIEISYARDKNGEPIVLYGGEAAENFTNHLLEGAKISEVDFRCTVLAAHNIINIPYRTQELDNALERASKKQKQSIIEGEEYQYIIPSSLEEYFEALDYENLEDYQKNERSNIKDIKIEVKGIKKQ